MPPSTPKAAHAQFGGNTIDQGNSTASDRELAVFTLRDTLKGISVREANFSEFLAALKLHGARGAKR